MISINIITIAADSLDQCHIITVVVKILRTLRLSVFGHFVNLALKGLKGLY